MHFGNDSRRWTIEKRECFFKISFLHKLSHKEVRNPSGKMLYLCILIPQSEYIKIQVYVTRKLFFGSVILSTR